jgi:hypothetical protein
MVRGNYSRDYRTLELKLGWPNSLTAHLEKELRAHFSEAWISGYESLIPRMTNDEKDRHVTASLSRLLDMLNTPPCPGAHMTSRLLRATQKT